MQFCISTMQLGPLTHHASQDQQPTFPVSDALCVCVCVCDHYTPSGHIMIFLEHGGTATATDGLGTALTRHTGPHARTMQV
jgi:hypothetical protein